MPSNYLQATGHLHYWLLSTFSQNLMNKWELRYRFRCKQIFSPIIPCVWRNTFTFPNSNILYQCHIWKLVSGLEFKKRANSFLEIPVGLIQINRCLWGASRTCVFTSCSYRGKMKQYFH